MKNLLFLIAFCLFPIHAYTVPLPEKFVAAEIRVESGGNPHAVGDNGAAIGCLQIHKACWQDAVQFDKSIGGSYSNCFNKDYSIKIMTAYLNRYCFDAVKSNNFEIMARTWNGGRKGKHNPKTLKYWEKVKSQLN